MFLVPEDFGSFALEIPVARYGFVYSDGLRQGQTHMASKGTTKIEKGFATKSSGTISHYVILHPSTSPLWSLMSHDIPINSPPVEKS